MQFAKEKKALVRPTAVLRLNQCRALPRALRGPAALDPHKRDRMVRALSCVQARAVGCIRACRLVNLWAWTSSWSVMLAKSPGRCPASTACCFAAACRSKQPGQVTRLFRRLHAHGLIAKIPHSRRWRVSLPGRRTMTTAIKLRELAYPTLFAAAA